jgi:uncharacterized protein with HEPN domain
LWTIWITTQATERIQKYTESIDEAAFKLSDMVQDAVIRNFEIIGEASSNIMRIDPGFINNHPELPLRFAYDMRNQLSHGYFTVDLGIVWRTAKRNIPVLGSQIRAMTHELRASGAKTGGVSTQT